MEKRVWRGRHCCVSRFLLFSCFERFAIREKRRKREWRGESEHVGYAWMETLLHGGCASPGPPYLDF